MSGLAGLLGVAAVGMSAFAILGNGSDDGDTAAADPPRDTGDGAAADAPDPLAAALDGGGQAGEQLLSGMVTTDSPTPEGDTDRGVRISSTAKPMAS